MGKYTNEPRLHPATGEEGDSAKFQVRMDPNWIRQMNIIVKSPKFPYVSKGEIARDALFRHFIWLETFEIPEGSILHQIQSMVDMLEEEKIQQGFERVVKNLGERVSYFTQSGARNEAIKCVLRTLGYVDEMVEGYWKDKFSRTIRERYAGLLKCAPKASLGSTKAISESESEGIEEMLNADISEEDIR